MPLTINLNTRRDSQNSTYSAAKYQSDTRISASLQMLEQQQNSSIAATRQIIIDSTKTASTEMARQELNRLGEIAATLSSYLPNEAQNLSELARLTDPNYEQLTAIESAIDATEKGIKKGFNIIGDSVAYSAMCAVLSALETIKREIVKCKYYRLLKTSDIYARVKREENYLLLLINKVNITIAGADNIDIEQFSIKAELF
jgi:hypothetical protein